MRAKHATPFSACCSPHTDPLPRGVGASYRPLGTSHRQPHRRSLNALPATCAPDQLQHSPVHSAHRPHAHFSQAQTSHANEVTAAVAFWHTPKPPLGLQPAAPAALHHKDLQTAQRRHLLVALGSLGLSAALPPALCTAAEGARLRSLRSQATCVLTVQNTTTSTALDVFWVNYDGDEEYFSTIAPSGYWIVDTFATHPWRVAEAKGGRLVAEVVAGQGEELLRVTDFDIEAARQGRPLRRAVAVGTPDSPAPSPTGAPQNQQQQDGDGGNVGDGGGAGARRRVGDQDQGPTTEGPLAVSSDGGFDGLGARAEDYAKAQLLSVAVTRDDAVVILGMEGYQQPLTLLVGLPEARTLVTSASRLRSRRPTTFAAWARSIKALGGSLQRVVVTRVVDNIFYARLVLAPTDDSSGGEGPAAAGGGGGAAGRVWSVDVRPSDALALAAEVGADIYVLKSLARFVQEQADDIRPEDLLAPGGPLDLDKLPEGLPSA